MQADSGTSFPDYDNPPLIETVLGVQFAPLRAFCNAHLGAFWKTLDRSEWSDVSHAPILQPQYERFADAERWAKGLQFQITQDPSARLRIKNAAGDRMIQIQNGRIHLNWLRVAHGDYPRYPRIREEFVKIFKQFADFATEEEIGEIRPNQWEITYVNHIPQGTVWSTCADWDFFAPLRGVPTIPALIYGESFAGEWHFVLSEKQGRLHIQWQHAVQSDLESDPNEVIRLTFTARGPLSLEDANNGDPHITSSLDLGRKAIVASFEKLMSESANEYWGLKNAGN